MGVPKALVVIAQQGYQDQEFAGTRDGFLEHEYDIVIASKNAGLCTGKFGGEEHASIALVDVRIEDYDKIAFVGGPGAIAYADEPEAKRIAREAVEAGKPLGAICIAPTILAKAGVLKGKNATVWDYGGEQIALLERSGAHYTGDLVTRDGLIVTANGPAAAEEFGKAIARI